MKNKRLRSPVRISIHDVIDHMGGGDWLMNGPVADAQHLPDIRSQLQHIRGCIEACCHYDFLNATDDIKAAVPELAEPYQLEDDIEDYPELMKTIHTLLAQR